MTKPNKKYMVRYTRNRRDPRRNVIVAEQVKDIVEKKGKRYFSEDGSAYMIPEGAVVEPCERQQ